MADVKALRREIDGIDEQIVLFLADRVRVCVAIGSAKKTNGLPVHDAQRESEVYARVSKLAAKLSLDPVQVELIYREIVNMCSSVQE
jgi:chorismate mutase